MNTDRPGVVGFRRSVGYRGSSSDGLSPQIAWRGKVDARCSEMRLAKGPFAGERRGLHPILTSASGVRGGPAVLSSCISRGAGSRSARLSPPRPVATAVACGCGSRARLWAGWFTDGCRRPSDVLMRTPEYPTAVAQPAYRVTHLVRVRDRPQACLWARACGTAKTHDRLPKLATIPAPRFQRSVYGRPGGGRTSVRPTPVSHGKGARPVLTGPTVFASSPDTPARHQDC